MKRLFLVAVLLFFSFLVVMYAVLPQFSDFNKEKKLFLQREQDVINRQNYYIKLKNTLTEAKNYQEALNEIKAALPGEIFMPALIDFFDQKAQTSGLTLKSFTPSLLSATAKETLDKKEKDKKENAPFQNFLLSLNGDVASFQNFLKDIETSARLVNVEEINFHKNEASESSEISLLVKVYY